MGWFSSSPVVQTAEEAAARLQRGRAALWRRDVKALRSELDPVISSYLNPAPHLAYRSLAHRMQSKFSDARKDAEKAVEVDPQGLEARFALSVAQLSQKDIEMALDNYGRLADSVIRDPGGHFLKLLGFVLYCECILNMEDDGRGMRVDFRLTPATRAMIRILDGYPDIAVKEIAQRDGENAVDCLAIALAAFRLADWSTADYRFTLALPMLSNDPFKLRLSLKRLQLDVSKRVES
jgi:tetratricopeptide (TPR) repeat protein